MSTSDLAITHDIVVARSLRGKRVDWAGTAFQVALLASLLVALAALVVLVGTVLIDGLPVFQERGFVVGNFPSSFADTWSDIGNFLANPTGLPGWLTTLVAFVVLPALVIWLIVKRHWKILIWSVVAVLGVTAVAGLVGDE